MGDTSKVFQYNYENNTVDICINIPFYDSAEELTYILIKKHDLPIYVDKGNLYLFTISLDSKKLFSRFDTKIIGFLITM